ncbi:MAG: hypothetical protein ABL872_10635 [Lacibacter sp.]
MKLKNCLLILSAAVFFSSCYYDKEEKIYGIAPCDTSNIKYSVQIVSTISTNCLRCHGGTATSGGGIQLSDYNIVKGLAQNGKLIGALTHSAGFSPMPKDGPQLSECRIAEIRTWIRNGALAN